MRTSLRRPKQITINYNGEERTLFEFIQIVKAFQQMDNQLLLEEVAKLSQYRINELKIIQLSSKLKRGHTTNDQLEDYYGNYCNQITKKLQQETQSIFIKKSLQENNGRQQFDIKLQTEVMQCEQESLESKEPQTTQNLENNKKAEQLKTQILQIKALLLQEQEISNNLENRMQETQKQFSNSQNQKIISKNVTKYSNDKDRLNITYNRCITTLWGNLRNLPDFSQYCSCRKFLNQILTE